MESMREKTMKNKVKRVTVLSLAQIYKRVNEFMYKATKGINLSKLREIIYIKSCEALHPVADGEEEFVEAIRNGIKSGAVKKLYIDDKNLLLPIILMPPRSGFSLDSSDSAERAIIENEGSEEQCQDEVYLFEEQIEFNEICLQRWQNLPRLPQIILFLQTVAKVRKQFAFHTWLEEIEVVISSELITLGMLVPMISSDEKRLQITFAQCVLYAFLVDIRRMDPAKKVIFEFLTNHGGKVNEAILQRGTRLSSHAIFDIISESNENFDVSFENDETKFSVKKSLITLV
ncbi:unnamed protein product, partial [Mesorhabditis belari]|uniref:Uncharacterized protein n=1 Tax=Mesorhabditis belari TaxID=2138241 RepID=A0AAF3E8D8_9BILA